MFTALPSIESVQSVSQDTNLLIVGVVTDTADEQKIATSGVPTDLAAKYLDSFGISVTDLAESLGASAEKCQVTVLPPPADKSAPQLVLVGLAGKPSDENSNNESIRRAAASAVRAVTKLPGLDGVKVAISFGLDEAVLEAAEGALLGSYTFTSYLSEDKPSAIGSFEIVSTEPANSVVEKAKTVAEAVCRVRDWVNTTASDLYPEVFANQAKELADSTAINCEILDEKALAEGGFGGLLAVGKGSVRPPRLVKFEYRPEGAKNHLVLVGKGITFDTGGLNLKTATGMYTMKSDMAGAATVLATTLAIADLGIKVNVTALASMAENMPSGSAYHPSDVLKIYNGKTVENVNSDAEGRLVLADALSVGSELSPDYMIDVATLTGACIVALGNQTTGLMSNSSELARQLLSSADSVGENLWQLPLPDYLQDGLKSKIADLKSGSAATLGAGALYAAQFLSNFVADGIEWAHFDIAGPSFNDGEANHYLSSGGTGVCVRTLVDFISGLED